MAKDPIGGRPLPFKIPTGIDALKARDADFWRKHGSWREAETAFEAWPKMPDECSHAEVLYQKSTALIEAMLSHPVRTGAALVMKIEAVRESDWDTINLKLPCGLTVGEVIEADAGRIAKAEIWGADAFQDMAEG
jgi:hypothetical protein